MVLCPFLLVFLSCCRLCLGGENDGTIDQVQVEMKAAKAGSFNGVRPIHYDLAFRTENIPASYEGEVTMHFAIQKSVIKSIVMHANPEFGLKVDPTAKIVSGYDQGIIGTVQYIGNNMIKIKPSKPLKAGSQKNSITLKFRGHPKVTSDVVADKVVNRSGLIYTAFDNDDKPTSVLVTISLQRFARTFWPSIDLPAMRATCRLVIYHRPNAIAASGMPVDIAGHGFTTFKKTAPLPTYHMVFAVMENFANHELSYPTRYLREMKTTLYVPNIKTADHRQTLFHTALPKIATALETYFGTPFSLSKIDFILNLKLRGGALENEGLIVFGYDTVSQFELGTVVHEMIHHWNGNRATVGTFGDMDLQEGLTVYLSGVIAQEDAQLRDIMTPLIQGPQGMIFARLKRVITSGGSPIKDTRDQLDRAYGKPQHFFKIIDEMIGKDEFKKVVRKHVSTEGGVTSWRSFERILAAYTYKGYNVGQFCRLWRSLSDFPVLTVRKFGSSIQVDQVTINGSPPEAYFPIKTKQMRSACSNTSEEFFAYTFPIDIEGHDQDIPILDPDSGRLMIVLYDLKSYIQIFEDMKCAKDTVKAEVLIQFLAGILYDLLPLEPNPPKQLLQRAMAAYTKVSRSEGLISRDVASMDKSRFCILAGTSSCPKLD